MATSAAALAALTMLLAPRQPAGASSRADGPLEIKGTTTYKGASLAIPTFDPDDSPAVLKENDFHQIIYNDLEMMGYFQRARNQSFVEETHQRDRKKGDEEIDFAEWRRIGADFLLKSKYKIVGEQLEVTTILYTVGSGKRIFGKRYTNARDQQRFVAHQISDEILRYAASEEGVANTKICYVSTSDPTRQSRDVWIMDADGAGARQLTNDHSLVATPCWGANATEIYYTSYKDYNPDLFGTYLKGGAPWTISRFPALNVSPAWSEAKQRIVLTLGKDGNSEIYTMDRSGKDLKRLTMERAIDSSPHWSPAGTDIVFTSDRTGGPQIYVMDGDGINAPQRISFVGSTYCDSAVWSPRGDKIAFASRMEGQFDIFVCEINGSNARRLTRGQGNNEDPSWAPNGKMLTFASDRTGNMQIYVMCDDGTNQRPLTRRGFNTSPAWSPQMVKAEK